ncbi:MAG: response regulator [Candidatus Alcyoniella australis]|nr:response regulator [Candidatus Alcyoniella australis]
MKTILIIEDVEDNRELLVQFLSAEYKIYDTDDGESGIDMARSIVPDLILMDLSLPKVSGWEATRVLKQDERTKAIPILAITAHAMVGDDARAKLAGCDGYLSKPVDFEELTSKINELLVS